MAGAAKVAPSPFLQALAIFKRVKNEKSQIQIANVPDILRCRVIADIEDG